MKITKLSIAFNWDGIIDQRKFFTTLMIEVKLVQFRKTYWMMFKCTINGMYVISIIPAISDIVFVKFAFNAVCGAR